MTDRTDPTSPDPTSPDPGEIPRASAISASLRSR